MGEPVIKKRKKPNKPSDSDGNLSRDAPKEAAGVTPQESDSSQQSSKFPKRFPPGTLKLQFAGSLVLVRNPVKELSNLARRFEVLFEALANMETPERILIYKMINGLMLTSIAKKTKDIEQKRKLFDLKNELYYNLANDRESRRKLAFMYLISKNFRILEFCPSCTTSNTEQNLKKHDWKFCKECKVDRNFFNVLSMHHKFNGGSATLFLSNDLLHKLHGIQLKKKGQLENISEEATYNRYHYNVQNMDSFDLQSVLDWNKKLLNVRT